MKKNTIKSPRSFSLTHLYLQVRLHNSSVLQHYSKTSCNKAVVLIGITSLTTLHTTVPSFSLCKWLISTLCSANEALISLSTAWMSCVHLCCWSAAFVGSLLSASVWSPSGIIWLSDSVWSWAVQREQISSNRGKHIVISILKVTVCSVLLCSFCVHLSLK